MWSWFWISATLVMLGWYLYTNRRPEDLMPERRYVVVFDEGTITVTFPRGEVLQVSWDEITRVGIRTTDEGPLLPDVFWGIHAGGDEPAVVFPGGATGEQELLEELQRRLSGFRNDQLLAAMRSTSNAYFLLWSSETGSGC